MYQILQPRVVSEPSFTLHAPVSSPPDRRQSTPPQRALPVLSHPRNLTGVTNEPVLNMGWFAGFWGPVHAECTRALQCCECATEGARTKAEDLFGASKITAANNMAIGAHFRSAAGPDRPIQTIPDGLLSQAGSDEILHSETGVQFQIGQKPKGNVLPAGRWRRCTSFITVSRRHWALFLPVVSAVGYPSGFWWPSLLMGARHRLGCGSGDSAMSGGWLLPLPGQSPQFARPGVGSISCYM